MDKRFFDDLAKMSGKRAFAYVRDICETQEISLYKLCDKAKIARQTVYRWQAGVQPTIEALLKIHDAAERLARK